MKTIKLLSLVGVAVGFCLTQAHAKLDLTPYATPGQPKNSGNAIPGWLDSAVSGYNNTVNPNPNLPTPGAGVGQNNVSNGGPFLILPQSTYGNYNYVVLHFGGGNQHDGYFAYYIGGDSTPSIKLENNSQQGLSWYEFFGSKDQPPTSSVPEPSTVIAGMLLLLPLGFSAVRILRKDRIS